MNICDMYESVIEIILDINSVFDDRIVDLKKTMLLDDINCRLEEIDYLRRKINQKMINSLL